MQNQSLEKLKSIARFLQVSNISNFQNWNIELFANFLEQDPGLVTIIENIKSKYVGLGQQVRDCFSSGEHINNFGIRGRINSFEEWVAVCLFYIKAVGRNSGNKVIELFIVRVVVQGTDQLEYDKNQFYYDCIEPILIYIELQIKQSHNTIRILERYKIMCEWYEKEKISTWSEVDITKNHLSKYLFDQGFTYSLAETNITDGRIDNLALSLGKQSAADLGNLPDVIVAEGKIFKGNGKVIKDVMNQTKKRIDHLSLSEGYCVVFNKSEENVSIIDADGRLSGIPYIIDGTKRIYFLIINLNKVFYKSKSDSKTKGIKLK